jgi:hypothetical protein
MKLTIIIASFIVAAAGSIQSYFLYSHFFDPSLVTELLAPDESINVSSVTSIPLYCAAGSFITK